MLISTPPTAFITFIKPSKFIVTYSVIFKPKLLFIVLIATLRKGRRKKNKNINVTEVKILDDDKKTIGEDNKQDSENNKKELNVIEEVNNDDFKLDEEMYDKVDNKKKKKGKKKKK